MPSAQVPITLDRPRILSFDMDALDAMERALNGIPLTQTLEKIRGISPSTLIIAIWAGLQSDDKTLNINLVRKMVKQCFADGRSYSDLATPVAEAIDASGLFATPEPEGNGRATTEKD